MTSKTIDELVANGTLTKMDDYEGVPIYCYSGVGEGFSDVSNYLLGHTTPLNIDKMNDLEPDNGVSTISTWLRENSRGRFYENTNHVYFYQIPEDTQLVASKPYDGKTSKIAKSVHAQGLKFDLKISPYGLYIPSMSEIAFYRRHRDHNNITNENHGGLIVPNCFTILSLDTIEKAKKCNGIIICSSKNYYEFNEKINNKGDEKSL